MKKELILTVLFACSLFFPNVLSAAGDIKAGTLVYEKMIADFGMTENFPDIIFLPRAEIGEKEIHTIDVTPYLKPASSITIKFNDPLSCFDLSHRDGIVKFSLSRPVCFNMAPADYTIGVKNSKQGRDVFFSGTLMAVKKTYSAAISFDFRNYPELEETDEVYIAGDMNSWNAKSMKLKKTDKKGIYKLFIPEISKGAYKYKFVAGGKWLCDNANVNREDDGFGSFNSVLTIGEIPRVAKLFPGDFFYRPDRVRFTVRYAGAYKKPALSCFYKGAAVPSEYISFAPSSSSFEIDFPTSIFKGREASAAALKLYCSYSSPEGRVLELSDERVFYRANSRVSPSAFRDSIIYFAMTDRFQNGDMSNDRPIKEKGLDARCNYQGGDFAGILKAARENYFNGLLVDLLWISPVLEGPEKAYRDCLPPHRKFSNYHGYWPAKLDKVEPRFGDWKTLRALTEELRDKNHIETIIDAVFRHVTDRSATYKDNKDLFLSLYLKDGSKNIRLFDKFPESTWFDEFLPAIDYGKTESVNLMVKAADAWIEKTGVRGFRLDAVKHIPLNFWSALLTGRNQFFTVGETIDSREKIASYISNDLMTAQFDFPLYFAIRDTFARGNMDFKKFDAEVEKSEKIFWSNHKLTSNLIGNHDFPRFMAYADGWLPADGKTDEKELGFTSPPKVRDPRNYAKLRQAYAFLMASNGVPLIYYGDEYGETGAGDPDNRRKMRFSDELNLFEKENVETLKKLILIRKQHPALFEGVRETIAAEKETYVFAKSHFNETLVIAFNAGAKPSYLGFKLPESIAGSRKSGKMMCLYDLLSGEKFMVTDSGKFGFGMKSHGFRYLMLLK
ncbi:MAG TPA: alpha-amylase family glycosyl hydrolase [Candidatus Wallbacteria bacterium]|nr:alpha-amylase family glycosyl hydrolase [Candidatus Wallbacteria bacterium]